MTSSTARVSSVSTEAEIAMSLARIVSDKTGIQLGVKQREMVLSRLKKRSMELKLESLAEYYEYYHQNTTTESQALISLLTTHHTFFFREFYHFEFLAQQALPKMVESAKKRGEQKIRIWSAACSRGQEVYSLAMFLHFHLPKIAPGFDFEILGTDVDPESVAIAKNGVYNRDEIKEVPMMYLADHWARGTGDIAQYVKVKSTLKNKVRFGVANLLDFSMAVPDPQFDVVFCRNVFIYFTHEQIKEITSQLIKKLNPEGYLFIGTSESLNGLNLPVTSSGPSIYAHPPKTPSADKTKTLTGFTKPSEAKTPAVKPALSVARSIRVLCVDDSPSILTLMKKILKPESGFEVVGIAGNGIEAKEAVQKLKPDVITLDIHMPEQTGIEYLEKNYKPGHPPVIMVSSVSRDNASLAFRALELGAVDYVEKPALANITDKAEELYAKLRSAHLYHGSAAHMKASVDQDFRKKTGVIKNPEKKARIIFASLRDHSKVHEYLKSSNKPLPPTFVLFEGVEATLAELSAGFMRAGLPTAQHVDQLSSAGKPGEIYLLDFKKNYDLVKKFHGNSKTSIAVYGDVSKTVAERVLDWSNAQLLLEDLGNRHAAKNLMEVATDIVPSTSFSYLCDEYFEKE